MKKKITFFLLLACLSACIDNNIFNYKAQLKSDISKIKTFLGDSLKATETPEGVWYSYDTAIGIYPVLSDTVTISYKAFAIPSMEEIDSSPPLPWVLSKTISGLQIGLPRFTVGSQGRLYIPSGLAYGQTGNDSIPPNTNLLFKITLTKAKGNRFTSDTTALNSYINTLVVADSLLPNSNVYKDPSGIRYAYDTLYGDPVDSAQLYPTLASKIKVSYVRTALNSKTPNVTAADTTLLLKQQIAAWKIILPTISKGSTVIMFVPSGFGYGSAPTDTSVPANSNLVYKLTLIDILK